MTAKARSPARLPKQGQRETLRVSRRRMRRAPLPAQFGLRFGAMARRRGERRDRARSLLALSDRVAVSLCEPRVEGTRPARVGARSPATDIEWARHGLACRRPGT